MFQALKDRAASGTIGDVAMLRSDKVDMWNVDCKVGTFDQMLAAVVSEAHVEDPSSVFLGMGAYASGANDDYNGLTKAWDNAILRDSLYGQLDETAFIESPYVQANNKERKQLGHAHDNADEMMASVADATLNNPDYVAQLLGSLGKQDRTTVLAAIKASYAVIGHGHPELRPMLTELEMQFEASAH